ncbi:MAG: HAD-IB family hydrolase [Actinocatenispora sp.]
MADDHNGRATGRAGAVDGPAERLAGAHILLTGATGFLGQATLEKLLSDYPDTRVSVLIRRRGNTSAQQRLTSMLRKPVFSRWRERVGDEVVTSTAAERVRVVEGDLSSPPVLPDDLDVVIHCASTVSFDPPIDDAFSTNVSGVVNLYEAIDATGTTPHVVHISTAYVAGARKGVVPEASLDHTVDWRTELRSAMAARDEAESDSRRPEALRKALADARADHGKAGPQSTALAAEEARKEWVAQRLIDYGRLRARSLGWPDVYTFTKALGERAAEQMWGGADRQLSIVRPAIVESALNTPYPGWIDGFKMADPIILAYGRGILQEFPGLPDGVLDVIPVDLVVNATLAVADAPAEPGDIQYFHVGSGHSNPLHFRLMYDNVRTYFEQHPMPDGGRGEIKVPIWKFPGSRQVERLLRTGERATSVAEQALLRLPASERTRDWMTKVHRKQRELEFLRKYSDLYGVYTEAEVIYTDDRLLALHETLPADRRERDGFDPRAIDWRHYLQDVHFPAVTATMRAAGARSGGRRPNKSLDLPAADNVLAAFDLEGTVIASNMIEAYLWARLAGKTKTGWWGELAELSASMPRYLRAERRDRGDFVRTFLRRYEGANADELRRLVADRLGDALLRRALPEAIRQVRRHKAAGHRTVLITGAVDVLVEPLAALFDDIVASRLHVANGRFTGYLDTPPLVGEARAAWLRRYAEQRGVDLSRSYAYGDSFSDRPLLEAVGFANAVNPDPKLYQHAKRKKWTIQQWGRHTSGPVEALMETSRDSLLAGSWGQVAVGGRTANPSDVPEVTR